MAGGPTSPVSLAPRPSRTPSTYRGAQAGTGSGGVRCLSPLPGRNRKGEGAEETIAIPGGTQRAPNSTCRRQAGGVGVGGPVPLVGTCRDKGM